MPPHERARAVSLTTSGMYLGSAGAMLALPALARFAGAASLPRFVGALGALWTVLWTAAGREVPHRCLFLYMGFRLSPYGCFTTLPSVARPTGGTINV